MAGRVRIPDLYIPRRSRYSELFSLYQTGVQAQLDVTGTVCLRLGDLGGGGGGGGKKCPDDILDGGGRSGQERIPREESVPLCARASADAARGPARLAAARHLPPPFTSLLTVGDVVPTEVEQLYQKV